MKLKLVSNPTGRCMPDFLVSHPQPPFNASPPYPSALLLVTVQRPAGYHTAKQEACRTDTGFANTSYLCLDVYDTYLQVCASCKITLGTNHIKLIPVTRVGGLVVIFTTLL